MKNEIKVVLNGKETTAGPGDTVLAVLIASGFKALKKSRKINESRGPLCGMGVCYECQVSINGEPNQRACMTEVADRMEIIVDAS
jgi:predicted molibdopterin-dependent oxidoreductase YjgC